MEIFSYKFLSQNLKNDLRYVVTYRVAGLIFSTALYLFNEIHWNVLIYALILSAFLKLTPIKDFVLAYKKKRRNLWNDLIYSNWNTSFLNFKST